jgi:hypothetical protein
MNGCSATMWFALNQLKTITMNKLIGLLMANGISYKRLPNNQFQITRDVISYDLMNNLQKIGFNVHLLDVTAIIHK